MGDTYLTKKMILLESSRPQIITTRGLKNNLVIGKGHPICSKFSDGGDVDVFLQTSPLTRGVIHELEKRGIVDQHLISLIGSYFDLLSKQKSHRWSWMVC
jgi:hypothetical protein